MGLSQICLCGCGHKVGHCESLILYHMDLYKVFSVSQVIVFSNDILTSSYFSYSSLDTCIITNTPRPKCGAPTQSEYTFKKEGIVLSG